MSEVSEVPEVIEGRCPGTTKGNQPCRAKPTVSGRCVYHTKSPELTEARRRGGRLEQARRALAQARVEALEQIGADPGALLPSLESIGTMSAFLANVLKRVDDKTLSPAQAAVMINGLRLGKDLLALGLEVRLLEQMEQHPAKEVK